MRDGRARCDVGLVEEALQLDLGLEGSDCTPLAVVVAVFLEAPLLVHDLQEGVDGSCRQHELGLLLLLTLDLLTRGHKVEVVVLLVALVSTVLLIVLRAVNLQRARPGELGRGERGRADARLGRGWAHRSECSYSTLGRRMRDVK